jgi:hypothetical protein
MASTLIAPQETLLGTAAGPASCDVLSVGLALRVEVCLLSVTPLRARVTPCVRHQVFTCDKRKLLDSVSFISRRRCLSRFFGRLRVRPSKTRLDPWFVRVKKARWDAGSPASTCGSVIPASGAFALFSPEDSQDARRSPETGCDFSLPGHHERFVLTCVVSQLAPARQPVTLRQAGSPLRVPISLISRADGGPETPCRLRSLRSTPLVACPPPGDIGRCPPVRTPANGSFTVDPPGADPSGCGVTVTILAVTAVLFRRVGSARLRARCIGIRNFL